MLKASAALLLALASAGSWSQETRPSLRLPQALACEEPSWDKEALGYEIEGETHVAFDLDDNGRPVNVRTKRGSGWALLDAMSERAIRTCRFPAPTDPQVRRSNITTAYTWRLEPSNRKLSAATLIAGSCAPSERFDSFAPLSGQSPYQEGMRVRLLLSPAGEPFGIKFEPDMPPESQEAGIAYLASCRFQPAQDETGPVFGNLVGRLLRKVH